MVKRDATVRADPAPGGLGADTATSLCCGGLDPLLALRESSNEAVALVMSPARRLGVATVVADSRAVANGLGNVGATPLLACAAEMTEQQRDPCAVVRLAVMAIVAVGIDVGLLTGKGLDLVALDDSRQIVDRRTHIRDVADVVRAVEALRPAVVCIDSPSQWVDAGTRRPAERELRRRGINLYATPPADRVRNFHHWMRDGMTVYAALGSRYPRYTGGDVQGSAAEYYPHAACVVLAGHVPALRDKVTVRRRLLAEHGVNEAALRGPDQVDAALGALTGLIALEGGHCWVGEGSDAMLLPTRQLLDRFARADAPEQGPPPTSESVSHRGQTPTVSRPRRSNGRTVQPGYVNRNNQTVLRATQTRGNDHGQYVYVLICGQCGHEYGSNGSDNFQRKCPRCQGGMPGLPY